MIIDSYVFPIFERLKRFLTIAFTLIYTVSTSGILIGQHLCMGRVNHSALFKQVDAKCGMTAEMHPETDGCCEDDWSLEIVEDEQQFGSSIKAPKANFHLLYEIQIPSFISKINEPLGNVFLDDKGPPDKVEIPLYLFYNTLKIPADIQS